MKLLFLDVDMRYMNPTRGLIPALLKQSGDAVLYGPGYQPADVLQRGLDAFVDREGPFDFVVGNEFSVLYADVYASQPWRIAHHQHRADATSLAALPAMYQWFVRYRGRKLVLLLENDAFHLSPEHIRRLEQTDAWYATLWDRRLMESIRDSPDLVHEPYVARVTDNFFEFVVANDQRMIALPHFVADNEFNWGALAHRHGEWNVPGASYYYRARARQTLGAAGVLRKRFPWMRVYGAMARLRLHPYANWLLLSIYGTQFTRGIESTRYSYTCGSAQHMHIRKHLEIPARGSVLVTAPVRGFDAMGFVDGVNCFIRMPDELAALHADLERDPELAQTMAAAGRDLVWSRHRLAHRARQLRASLEAIARGAFAGSYWENGDWVVRTAPVPA